MQPRRRTSIPTCRRSFGGRVARLAETLNDPADRVQAAQAIGNLIARVILTPGDETGEIKATLEGELGTIRPRIAQQGANGARTILSVSVVAGVGFEPTTFRL